MSEAIEQDTETVDDPTQEEFVTWVEGLVSRLHDDLGDRDRSSRMWIPIESLFLAAEQPLPPNGVDTEWTEPQAVVQQRWHDLAIRRRALLSQQ